jgi:flagellar biosynthesis protein FlhB
MAIKGTITWSDAIHFAEVIKRIASNNTTPIFIKELRKFLIGFAQTFILIWSHPPDYLVLNLCNPDVILPMASKVIYTIVGCSNDAKFNIHVIPSK